MENILFIADLTDSITRVVSCQITNAVCPGFSLLTVEIADDLYQKFEDQARENNTTPSDILLAYVKTCVQDKEANQRLVVELDRRSAKPAVEVDLKSWARDKIKSYANNAQK